VPVPGCCLPTRDGLPLPFRFRRQCKGGRCSRM
jgi:hypothetical protein